MQATPLPIADIDATCLPRDRAALEPAALATLQSSILAEGLRQPIEVFPMEGSPPWGLISGLRRLTVFRQLAADGFPRFAEIPAFIRQPADMATALAAMVSENEAREGISPWEKAALILTCTEDGHFPTHDAAIDGLFPHSSRPTRAHIRQHVEVAMAFEGLLATPEALTTRQMDRLSTALRAGLADLIEATLREHRRASLAVQWQALTPIFAEALREDLVEAPTTPGRPRRMLHLKQGLLIRRELSKDGWILRFSGPEARKGALLDDVFDMVERMFQKWD